MAKSKAKSLPYFDSLDNLVEFFETRDIGEYWEQMPEAQFDVNLKRRKHLVAIDEETSAQLTEIARSKKVSSEELINSWLKEKIRKVG
jgi:CopG antitoxin of type II toxin-antitoxin system